MAQEEKVPVKKSNFRIRNTTNSEGIRVKKEVFIGSYKGHVRKMRALWNKH
jgi:hypothetical protein